MKIKKQLLTLCLVGLWALTPNNSQADDPPPPNESLYANGEEVFHLSGFEPFYLLYGQPTSKIKFSFKYQLTEKIPIYFGYNQYIFWAIGKESNPFRDVTYSPEFFYRWTRKENSFLHSIDFIPFWHMSNGKDGDASRSLNRAAIQLNALKILKDDVLHMSLRVASEPYDMDATNEDIQNYIGPWEFRASYSGIPVSFLREAEVSLRYFTGGTWGQNFKRGGREIGLSFRLAHIDMTPAFYIQYFEGNGQSLLNYSNYDRNVRVGFKL